jgi:hypothetical protein
VQRILITDPSKLLYGSRTPLHRACLIDAAQIIWQEELEVKAGGSWLECRNDSALIERLLDGSVSRETIKNSLPSWIELAGEIYKSQFWCEREANNFLAYSLAQLEIWKFATISSAIEPIARIQLANSPLSKSFLLEGAFSGEEKPFYLPALLKKRIKENKEVIDPIYAALIFETRDVGPFNYETIPPIAFLPEGFNPQKLPMLSAAFEELSDLLSSLTLWSGGYMYHDPLA